MSAVLVFLLISAGKLALVGIAAKPMVVVTDVVRVSVCALAAGSCFPSVKRGRPWLWPAVKALLQFGHLENQV